MLKGDSPCGVPAINLSLSEQETRLLQDYRSLDHAGQEFVRHTVYLAMRVHGLCDCDDHENDDLTDVE